MKDFIKRGGSVLETQSLFQETDGGSIPTSPHQLLIIPVGKKEAAECFRKWHYFGEKDFLASHCFGVVFNRKLLGAISYGIPNAKNIKGLYTKDSQGDFMELTRLALSPDCPKNSESRVISITLKMIRKHGYKGVVTYADTAQGHTGVIYKASNFEYKGLTAQKTDLFVNGKMVGKLKGVRYRDIKGNWVKRSRKHLFVRMFDKTVIPSSNKIPACIIN